MTRIPLNNVRVMTLREIAEMWAAEAQIPVDLMLRELRLAVINIPRLEKGEGLIEEIPPDDELPDPDEKVERNWLLEVCGKQGWAKPEFWFGEPEEPARRFPGRPGYPHRMALERELTRRGQQGEFHDKLAPEMRSLREWALDKYPDDMPPTWQTLENTFRYLFWDLKREMPDDQ